jgi:hypothetical protein
MDISAVRRAYINFLKKHDWQWHATLSFVHPVSVNNAEKQLKQWVRKLKEKEKLQVAGLAIYVENRANPHIHILMTSKSTPFNNTLREVDHKTWEDRWPYSCKITTYREWGFKTVAKYIAKEKNLSLYAPDEWHLIMIRTNLLIQLFGKSTAK